MSTAQLYFLLVLLDGSHPSKDHRCCGHFDHLVAPCLHRH